MRRSKSEVNGTNPIRLAAPCQFNDPGRDLFPVGLEPVMDKGRQAVYQGMPLYRDSSGQRWALKGT